MSFFLHPAALAKIDPNFLASLRSRNGKLKGLLCIIAWWNKCLLYVDVMWIPIDSAPALWPKRVTCQKKNCTR